MMGKGQNDMSDRTKNIVIVVLCLIITGALGLSIYGLWGERRGLDVPNPNVTLVAAPDQEDFEEHPEWVAEEPEIVDYGENLALGKDVKQNGQTQIYNCKNAVDGDRYTYWEGKPDSYPSEITVDLGEVFALSGAQILLSPNHIWSARTQEVEVQISDDNETFTTIVPRTVLSFDPEENNCAYMAFEDGVQGRYVRFSFYSNTEATAGQAAEIEIYGA